MKFDTLGLSSPILNAITECGYQQLTQVQQQVIPLALTGEGYYGLCSDWNG